MRNANHPDKFCEEGIRGVQKGKGIMKPILQSTAGLSGGKLAHQYRMMSRTKEEGGQQKSGLVEEGKQPSLGYPRKETWVTLVGLVRLAWGSEK